MINNPFFNIIVDKIKMNAKLIFFMLLKAYFLFFLRKSLFIDKRYEPKKLTVYSQDFYLRRYPEYEPIFAYNKKALFKYFNTTGIKNGECASPAFDVRYYLENNRGLKDKFGYNYTAVYEYFLTKGKYVTDEFSPIFNCKYYMENNQDLKKHLGEKIGRAHV